jgi:hypothetical protein
LERASATGSLALVIVIVVMVRAVLERVNRKSPAASAVAALATATCGLARDPVVDAVLVIWVM